jgi:hypothetical protein
MRHQSLWILFLLLFLSTAHGEEAVEEWMTFYYKKPAPESVGANLRELIRKGHLDDQMSHPPIVGFLSEVMAQNPGKVRGWLKEFEDLQEAKREAILGAAWMSNTEESRAYFKEAGLEEYENNQAPKILEMEVNSPTILDMLWGSFLATGDIRPIRRLVSAFELSKHSGAVERYKNSRTEENEKEAHLEMTFRAAMWSLESNCQQHPKVLGHCEKIFTEKDLPVEQKKRLGEVLAKMKPETYGPEAGKKQV